MHDARRGGSKRGSWAHCRKLVSIGGDWQKPKPEGKLPKPLKSKAKPPTGVLRGRQQFWLSLDAAKGTCEGRK